MKRISLSVAFLLCGSLLFAQTPAKRIPEGIITYSVEWKLPENMQQMAANFPAELTVFFKGDSSSLKTESQMYSSTSILNTKKEYECLKQNDVTVLSIFVQFKKDVERFSVCHLHPLFRYQKV